MLKEEVLLLKTFALCLVGIWCLAFSIGFTIAVVQFWVFSGVLEGEGYVPMKSVMYWLYMSFVSVVAGTIGGYLIGRYLPLKESSIEKA